MPQQVFKGKGSIQELKNILDKLSSKKYLLVCSSSYQYLTIKDDFSKIHIPCVIFSDFTSNPLYEDVVKGVEIFNRENCDTIIAVGGGSSIDVAKCIKLFCKMIPDKNYLSQEYFDNGIPLISIPTTAGTGSESTRYAVIYYDGKKQSVTHDSIIPNYVILEPDVLKTLPTYQKKCTLLDAFCQGIESWWSVNSTQESRQYSKIAIENIIRYKDEYINDNSSMAAEKILIASNYSGKAINIAQTTAPHAMSYKLTSMYNLPHGHAVAICLPKVWQYMIDESSCADPRGRAYLDNVFCLIGETMGGLSPAEAIKTFEKILADFEIGSPKEVKPSDISILTESVNTTRLKNNPVALSSDIIRLLYSRILNNKNLL